MKTSMLILMLTLHIILCLFVALLIRMRVLKVSGQLLPIVFFVPVWGMLTLFCADYITRRQSNGRHITDLHQFTLGQDDYRRIRVSDHGTDALVVPLEEAILINDPKIRRKLMMDIISGDSHSYVTLLQKARFNNDIEVAHYASTAIMEIQREYELRIQRARLLCEQEPQNPVYYEKLADTQKMYIDSGLIGENVLVIERRRYADLLKKIMELTEQNTPQRIYTNAIDNELELKHIQAAEQLLALSVKRWPESEQLWLLKLKLCYQTGNGTALRETLSALENANIFLSPETRERISFWTGEGADRHAK